MTFDKPEHKELVLDMLNKVSVPGQLVELFYELKKAALAATIEAAETLSGALGVDAIGN